MKEQEKLIILDKVKLPFFIKKHIILMFLFFLVHMLLYTQDETKVIHIKKIEHKPKIDGVINDGCWKGIEPVSGFYQYDPVNGVKATEQTYVWTAYDEENIYFAFQMDDTQPERIYAELTPRNEFYSNDSISVILDTYYDKRTSIIFTLNPKGIQANSVETIWHGSAMINEKGWSAEMAIPFKSLRFPKNINHVWGVNFKRYIHRLKETDYWTKISRDEPLLLKSGVIAGLRDIKPGHNIEFFPYAGYRYSRWEEEKDTKFASGIDFKYGITSNLALDLTVSPDYSEVEADPYIYQLSPYEIKFMEYRPFFTESSNHFKSNFLLFYSRRIDSPKLAIKLTGKSKGVSLGILGAIDKDTPNDAYFSIFRLKKDVLDNSEIGFYFTGLNQGDFWNRNIGFDCSFQIKNIYHIKGQAVLSYTYKKQNKDNGMYFFYLSRSPDAGINLSLSLKRVEKNVDVKTGFVSKKDYQNLGWEGGYAWRIKKGFMKYLKLYYSGYYNEDSYKNPTERGMSLVSTIKFRNESRVHAYINTGEKKLQVYQDGELTWSKSFFSYKGFFLEYSFWAGRFVKSYGFWISSYRTPIYTEGYTKLENGTEKSLEAEIDLRPLSFLELSFKTGIVEQELFKNNEKIFSGTTYETSLHYQITKSLFLNTRIKGESRYDQYSLDILLGYYFGAGNIIQLSYKRRSNVISGIKEKGYSLVLKVSYLLRI